MTTPEERIRELGLEIPEVAAPLASYVPAARSGSYVYTSGQLPIVKGELAASAHQVVLAAARVAARVPAEVAVIDRVRREAAGELDADGHEPVHDREHALSGGRHDVGCFIHYDADRT